MNLFQNAKDLYNNPADYLTMVTDRLRNLSGQKKAVINSQGAGMVPMTNEEFVGEVTRGVTENMGGGGSGALGTIMGKNSRLWNQAAAADAFKRLSIGENPAKVWQDTGTGRFPSGELFQEFSDVAGNYRPGGAYKRAMKREGAVPQTNTDLKAFEGVLPDIYNDPRLYDAYPELRKKQFEVVSKDIFGHGHGENYPGGLMRLRSDIAHKDRGEGKELLLHETKHEIEDIERWPVGGQPRYIKERLSPLDADLVTAILRKKGVTPPTNPYGGITLDDLHPALQTYVNSHGTRGEYDRLYNIAEALRNRQIASNRKAFKNYQDLSGEAFARLVPKRSHLDDAGLRAQYPLDPDYFHNMTGSDINNLIVRY